MLGIEHDRGMATDGGSAVAAAGLGAPKPATMLVERGAEATVEDCRGLRHEQLALPGCRWGLETSAAYIRATSGALGAARASSI